MDHYGFSVAVARRARGRLGPGRGLPRRTTARRPRRPAASTTRAWSRSTRSTCGYLLPMMCELQFWEFTSSRSPAVGARSWVRPPAFGGTIGRYRAESEAWWPEPARPPSRRAQRRHDRARRRRLRPARLLRLRHRHAEHRRAGRRRAALPQLPHRRAVLADPGLPADRTQPPLGRAWAGSPTWPPASPATTPASRRRPGCCPRCWCPHGYAAYAVGKWHLTPEEDLHLGAPRSTWPLGRGFERFYGFIGGETNQFEPALAHDNHRVRAAAHGRRAATT